MLPDSHYWPIWAWPDGNPRNNDQNPEILAVAENYFGWWNEPYGANQANISAIETIELWDDFMEKVTILADAKRIPVEEIKLVGPSISPGKEAMTPFLVTTIYHRVVREPGLRSLTIDLGTHQFGLLCTSTHRL